MWRNLVYLYLIYVVAEGALRKWILPEYSNELFMLKDLILAAAAAAMAGETLGARRTRFLSEDEALLWVLWIALFCSYALIGGFSLTALAGLRYYLAALPLAFVLPHLLRDWNDLRRMVGISLYLTIGICILGYIQYSSTLDSPINQYAWTTADQGIATFGVENDRLLDHPIDRPRITGTFSYISTYASFLQFMFLVAWVTALTGRTGGARLAAYTALFAVFMNIAMTGSRAPTLIATVISVPFAILLIRKSSSGLYQAGIALALVAASVGGLYGFSDPFAMILLRDEGAGDAEERISGALLAPIATIVSSSWLGEGIGATFGGLAELGITSSLDWSFDEVNLDRIGIETGIIGYLFVLMVKITYMVKTLALVFRARSFDIRVWALAIFGYQLGLLWAIPLYNSVASALYFSALGLFYWLRYQNTRVGVLEPKRVGRSMGLKQELGR